MGALRCLGFIVVITNLFALSRSQFPVLPIPELPLTIRNLTQLGGADAFAGLDTNSPFFSNAAIASLFDAVQRPAAPEPNVGLTRSVAVSYYDTVNFGGHVLSELRDSLSFDWFQALPEPFSWRFSPQAFSVRMLSRLVVPADVRIKFVARAGGPVAVYLNEESGKSKIVVDGWNVDSSTSAPILFDGISATRRFLGGKSTLLKRGMQYTMIVIHSTEESLSIEDNRFRMLQVAMTGDNSNEVLPIPSGWLQNLKTSGFGGGGIYASFYSAVKSRDRGLQTPSYSTIIQPTFSSPNVM